MKTNDICSLVIVNKNLINGEDNEEIYYSRLSDEFVRYNKFKNFIFENNALYNYGSVEYNILENELLLFHSTLTQEYLKDLTTSSNQTNVKNTFDTLGIVESNEILNFKNLKKEKIIIAATKDKLQTIQEYYEKNKSQPVPLITQSEIKNPSITSPEYSIDSAEIAENLQFIEKNSDTNYKCDFYKNLIREGMRLNFKEPLYELGFHFHNKLCSFQLILIIIKHNNSIQNSNLTINDIKKKLYELYIKDVNFEILCYILLKNNKKAILEKVINKELSFEDLMYSTDYYITYIDIYMLAKEYNLPIIFLCNSAIDLTITDENYIICNINKLNQEYYFFKVPSKYSRKKEHNYKLLFNKQSIKINIENDLLDTPSYKLYSKLKKDIKFFINPIENYITNFDLSKLTNTKYKVRQVKKVEIKVN
jgi:hypothetical protein